MQYLVITGASSGIGLAAAAAFIEAGYKVINLSRKPCDLGGVVSIPCDLADPGSWDSITQSLFERC